MLMMNKKEFVKNLKENFEKAVYEDIIVIDGDTKNVVVSLERYKELLGELREYKEYQYKNSLKKNKKKGIIDIFKKKRA